MKQTITPPVNSQFTASIGDWITNGVWNPNMGPGSTPCIWWTMTQPPFIGTMTLAYPNIKPKPGLKHHLHFSSTILIHPGTFIVDWELTDGAYSFTGSFVAGSAGSYHDVDEDYDIPADWNQNATQLIITINQSQDGLRECAITNVTLAYTPPTTYIDYLPLMGIG